jgi:dUTP pyrophosphatase
MTLKIKIEDERLLQPEYQLGYATPGAAAIDLRACIREPVYLYPQQMRLISAGFRVEMPTDRCLKIYPRSGLGVKSGIVLANQVGVVDADYRGLVQVALLNRNHEGEPFLVKPMDRIAQATIERIERPEIVCVNALSVTARGQGGLGSTGVA